jgi:deoxyribodipyrimidine photolyase
MTSFSYFLFIVVSLLSSINSIILFFIVGTNNVKSETNDTKTFNFIKNISTTLKKAEKIYLENNLKIDERISSYSKKKKINKDIEAIYPEKNWNKKFEKYWDPSEEKAIEILNNFIKNNIEYYATNRDIPSLNGTSKLSPYLKFGQISVHQIMNKCLMIKSKKIGFRKFINEIGWREFSHSLLHNFPEMEKNNLRKEFDKFNFHYLPLKSFITGTSDFTLSAGVNEPEGLPVEPPIVYLIIG